MVLPHAPSQTLGTTPTVSLLRLPGERLRESQVPQPVSGVNPVTELTLFTAVVSIIQSLPDNTALPATTQLVLIVQYVISTSLVLTKSCSGACPRLSFHYSRERMDPVQLAADLCVGLGFCGHESQIQCHSCSAASMDPTSISKDSLFSSSSWAPVLLRKYHKRHKIAVRRSSLCAALGAVKDIVTDRHFTDVRV